MPRRASGSSRTKSVDETKRSTIRFSCTRFNSSAFCENANADEDWTKIPDLAERRRIQNRIAQRNYRKKLKQRMDEQNMSESSSDTDSALSRKPSTHESPRSQPPRQGELQWQPSTRSSSVGGSMAAVMASPTFSDSASSFEQGGSLFSGRSSYSPPALSTDEESNYDSYQTHASSSISSTSPFADDFTFPLTATNEKAFGEITDWAPFDGGFSFDPTATWSEPQANTPGLLEPLQTQFFDRSPIFSATDGQQQGSLKADPMLGFALDQVNDYFTQPWSA